jgi:hypothetical protein
MDKQEIEVYLMELDQALTEAFPNPEPITSCISTYPLISATSWRAS